MTSNETDSKVPGSVSGIFGGKSLTLVMGSTDSKLRKTIVLIHQIWLTQSATVPCDATAAFPRMVLGLELSTALKLEGSTGAAAGKNAQIDEMLVTAWLETTTEIQTQIASLLHCFTSNAPSFSLVILGDLSQMKARNVGTKFEWIHTDFGGLINTCFNGRP